jgi:DNA end-binding protein Ku
VEARGVARSIWKGAITFGMVTIPVRLFPATQEKDVSFHLLHAPDHSRIKFKRFCETEDREVPNEELVRAFEVSKDQYVEVTDEDLEKLPLPSKHTIELSAFVNAGEIDPIYYEKSYYLEPEETGLKPYALLTRVLENKGATGVAKIALRNKEHLCALRPLDGTLVLETLYYPDEIRERELKLPNVLVNERELAMASSLVEALSEAFDPSKYHDQYREALLELINSKTQGREVVVPAGGEVAAVSDLMAALRASVEAARKRRPEGEPTEAAREVREAAAAQLGEGRGGSYGRNGTHSAAGGDDDARRATSTKRERAPARPKASPRKSAKADKSDKPSRPHKAA